MIKVAKVVIKKGNKYLLIKRSSESKFFPNQWDFSGGKLEEGKREEDSAKRETKEETSLNINLENIKIEGELTENCEQIKYSIFIASEYNGKIKLSEDHSEYLWINKKEIPKYKTTPFVKIFLKKIKDQSKIHLNK